MKRMIIITMIFISTINIYSQTNSYLFERKANESPTAFFKRHFNGYCGWTHQILEGYWGDESKGKKIVVFYNCPLREEYNGGAILVFQPVGDGKNYLLMSMDLEKMGGVIDEIISAFYLDANGDGIKELFVIIKAQSRTSVVMEEEDENGAKKQYNTMACCEDDYITLIVEQLKYLDEGFLPTIKCFPIDGQCELHGPQNAEEVKKWIKEYLEKEK